MAIPLEKCLTQAEIQHLRESELIPSEHVRHRVLDSHEALRTALANSYKELAVIEDQLLEMFPEGMFDYISGLGVGSRIHAMLRELDHQQALATQKDQGNDD